MKISSSSRQKINLTADISVVFRGLNLFLTQKLDKVRFVTACRVIHGYDKIDDAIVWGTIIRHLPILKKEIQSLIE